MQPAAIHDVAVRMATIERRFGVPQMSFEATLREVNTALVRPAATTKGGTGRGVTATSGLTPGGAANPALTFSGGWAAGLPPAGRAWASSIERAALRAGVEPALLASVVWAESAFRPEARSHAGAIGLAQLMPGTAAGLGVDPRDPEQNLDGGARYLGDQLRRFDSPELALAAYNAGPARVEAAGGIPPIAETRAYVSTVLNHYERLRGRS